ncbi:hypothetical protein PWT90_01041 [Aphanocladium album]|nr:hypothetical protein PWT90_01041 [Aphanocladium album]
MRARNSLDVHVPAYDSVSVDSSPSYALDEILKEPSEQSIFTPLLVSKRWVINMPDYEGLRAVAFAGNNTGHAVLDSIRTVQSLSRQFGLEDNFKQTVYGFSGGGLPASGRRSRSHLSSVQMQSFPDARQILLDNLHKTGPYNAATFLRAIELDLEGTLKLFKDHGITKYFINGFDFFAEPAFAHAFLDNAVAGRADTPTIPLYMYHAYCAAGASIEYRRNTIGDHKSNSIVEGIRALNWLDSIFHGSRKPLRGCSRRNASSKLGFDSLALVALVFSKQGYTIAEFLRLHPMPGFPKLQPNATNSEDLKKLHLSSRLLLHLIGLRDKDLAAFNVTDGDLADLGVR